MKESKLVVYIDGFGDLLSARFGIVAEIVILQLMGFTGNSIRMVAGWYFLPIHIYSISTLNKINPILYILLALPPVDRGTGVDFSARILCVFGRFCSASGYPQVVLVMQVEFPGDGLILPINFQARFHLEVVILMGVAGGVALMVWCGQFVLAFILFCALALLIDAMGWAFAHWFCWFVCFDLWFYFLSCQLLFLLGQLAENCASFVVGINIVVVGVVLAINIADNCHECAPFNLILSILNYSSCTLGNLRQID